MSNRKTQNFFRLVSIFAFLVSLTGAVVAQPESDKYGVWINRHPLKDFSEYAKRKIETKSVDLDAIFSVELTGKLGKSGKLDPSTVVYAKSEGDEKMIEVVKKAIEAINDSGWFAYLTHLGGSDGNITIRAAQNELTFTSSIAAEMPTESKARSVASALRMLSQMASMTGKDSSTMDKDELLILNSIAVSSEGKACVLKLNMPKASFREMIVRKLTETSAAPKS